MPNTELTDAISKPLQSLGHAESHSADSVCYAAAYHPESGGAAAASKGTVSDSAQSAKVGEVHMNSKQLQNFFDNIPHK